MEGPESLQDVVQRLKDLASDKNIRDSRKLYQFARSKGLYVTSDLADKALKDSVPRQVLE